MGYSRAEVVGKHHSMFAEAGFAASSRVPHLLGQAQSRRESTSAPTSASPRAGARCGSRLRTTRSPTPVASLSRWSSTPPTSPRQTTRNADFAGQLAAIGRVAGRHRIRHGRHGAQDQRKLLRASWVTRGAEVVGKHHSMFADNAFAASAEYRAFWAKLNRGECESATSSGSPRAAARSGSRPRTTRFRMPMASRSRW